MDDIYKSIEEQNPNKKHKILIVSDDMIADMLNNKKLNPVVTELVMRRQKTKHSIVCVSQSYFIVPKNVRPISTHHFIMKTPNKQALQQIAFNHSSDVDFKDFMNLCKKCTAKPYSFLVIDATLALDNPLCFTNNLLEKI